MKVALLTTDNREQLKDYSNPKPHFGAAPEALIEGFAQVDAQVHVVSCVRQEMKSPERLAPNIYYHPVLVPKIGWMTTAYQGCIRAIRTKLNEIKPDIVHGQGTERDCAMTAVHSGYSNVLTIHGNMAEIQRLGYHGHKLYGRLASLLESYALRRTAGVFCNSLYTRGIVAPRAKETWLVPNPLRGLFFDTAARVSGRSEIPHLLNVGLISPRKRQLEVLREMGALHRSGFKLRIVFAGQLSEATEYGKAFANELRNAEAYAQYAGFLNTSQLIELMDQVHGFIHFPGEEAFGLVVAEAMARGLRFFGSNVGGIADISHGIDGAELCADFAELNSAVGRWLSAGAPLPESAANQIAARYHPRVIAQRHLEIYREVLREV